MVHITFNVPLYRFRITIIQKRRGHRDYLLTLLDELIKVRVGSRFSRIARRILHLKRLQRFVGVNLIGLILSTNLASSRVLAFTSVSNISESGTLPAVETPISTVVARRYPVNSRPSITQGFSIFHAGVDIDGATGDPLYPIMNGRIESTSRDFFLGNKVVVDHGNGYKSVYAHMNSFSVVPNQEVTTATKLGEMGNTGHSFGDHVHLEVYKDGKHVNPMSVLPPLQ